MTDPSQALDFLRWLVRDFKGDDPALFADAVAHVRNVLPQLIGVVSASEDLRAFMVDELDSDWAQLHALSTALTALAEAVAREQGAT